jgi:hypothetical protein
MFAERLPPIVIKSYLLADKYRDGDAHFFCLDVCALKRIYRMAGGSIGGALQVRRGARAGAVVGAITRQKRGKASPRFVEPRPTLPSQFQSRRAPRRSPRSALDRATGTGAAEAGCGDRSRDTPGTPVPGCNKVRPADRD